jgi:hypothetical protein
VLEEMQEQSVQDPKVRTLPASRAGKRQPR